MADVTDAEQISQASEPESQADILSNVDRYVDDAFKRAKEKGGLTPADAPALFSIIGQITDTIKKIDEENPTGPDETDPRIVALLRMAHRVQRELDPLVRENFKDKPEKLAEWDDIMKDCKEAYEKDSEE